MTRIYLQQGAYGAYPGYGGAYASTQPASVPQSTAYAAYPPYPGQVLNYP